MIDVGYIGNHQVHLSYSNSVSAIPLLPLLSRSPKRDAALTTLMGTGIANPFLGLIGNTTYGTAGTLTNAAFGTITTQANIPRVIQQSNP